MPQRTPQGLFRSLNPASILACALLAAAAIVGTEPWSKTEASGCFFEARVESTRSGLVQVFYDTGSNFNGLESSSVPIGQGEATLLRFELPYGSISRLRFDPLDTECRVTVGEARIVGTHGETLRRFATRDFQPLSQIASISQQGSEVVITSTPGATDPSVTLGLAEPLSLMRTPVLVRFLEVFGLSLLATALLGMAWNSPGLGLGEHAGPLWRWASGKPALMTAGVALSATLFANYPVVFSGKSFVSPTLGVPLLYGQNPWLPGAPSAEEGNMNKSDVAALLWHHLPLSMLERKALFEDAELPLWNRYDSGGLPLLGQGQSCFGDPLHMIPVLANGAAWSWDLKFILAKWLFSMGIGLCAWRCFRHLPTALILAASSAFIGFFIYRINHPAIFSLSYAPWILYCWIRCVESIGARSAMLWLAGLIGANWWEMNSGTAKEAYALLFAMNLAGACVLLASERSPGSKFRLLVGAALAGGLFTMISAPVWFTFYKALKISYTSYNAPQAFQIQPGMFVGLFDEAFYRPFQEESGVINPSVNFLVLVAFLWTIVRARALVSDRRALALLAASVPAFALVFGVVPPGVIARTPFLGNILHVDNAFSCALIVVLSVLSGFGLRDMFRRLGSEEGRRDAMKVFWILVGLFAVYFGTAQAVVRSAWGAGTWGRVIKVDDFIYGYALSLVVGAGLLLGSVSSILRKGITAASFVALVLAACFLHWREGFETGSEYPTYVAKPTDRFELTFPSMAVDTITSDAASPSRAIGFHNDLLPGWNSVYGIEGISGPDALSNPYYRQLLDIAGINRLWDWRYIIESSETKDTRPILDLLGVRYYVGYHVPSSLPDPGLSHVASVDMEVFKSPTAWPRAFFTNGIAVYSDLKQYWSWVKYGDGRPFAGIQGADWVGLPAQPKVTGDLASRSVVAASNYRMTTNTTSFTVNATGPGVIVLTEAYEPDNFRVWLNGQRVPCTRVNNAFKGVIVQAAGTYDVKFSYWPRGLSASLNFCYVGLGLLGALLVFAFRLKPAKSAV